MMPTTIVCPKLRGHSDPSRCMQPHFPLETIDYRRVRRRTNNTNQQECRWLTVELVTASRPRGKHPRLFRRVCIALSSAKIICAPAALPAPPYRLDTIVLTSTSSHQLASVRKHTNKHHRLALGFPPPATINRTNNHPATIPVGITNTPQTAQRRSERPAMRPRRR